MARLDDVVGAILRDLSLAQDVASKHSRMLAVEYASDPVLRQFPVPRTALSEVELELRFAPTQLKRVSGSPERTTAIAKDAFDRYAPRAAAALLEVARDRLETARALPAFPQSMLDEVRSGLVSPEFEAYVIKAISTDLFAARTKIVKPPDQIDEDAARDTTVGTAARVIFEHPDLKTFIEANPRFTADALAEIQSALATPLTALANDFAQSDLRAPEYELEVDLDPEQLPGSGTASRYSTIRLRAQMRNYRWVITPGAPDQLVEEG